MTKQTFKEWREELSRDKLFLVTSTITLLACLFGAIQLFIKGVSPNNDDYKMEMCMSEWHDFKYCRYKIYGLGVID